jgi:translation initiation factor IF-2
VRVYELAKELGLENRAVLVLCEDLGIDGKNSHSNALTDHEAEKIRRHVIRSAVSEKGDSIKEVRRSGSLVTEKRVGGSVIRRRKKSDELDDTQELADEQGDAELLLSSELENVHVEKIEEESGVLAEEGSEEQEDLEESSLEEPSEVTELEELESAGLSSEEIELARTGAMNDARKRLDIRAPKILGKIELPIKQVRVAKDNGQNRNGNTGKPAGATAESESAFKSKRKKKDEAFKEEDDFGRKPKKKQVLRKDELLDYDGERELWKGKKDKGKKKDRHDEQESDNAPAKVGIKLVKIQGEISVGEFAKQLGIKAGQVIAQLMGLGVMATINHLIDFETATLIAEEFGAKTVNTQSDIEDYVATIKAQDEPEQLKLRPPVVTVMGHVDHGKTSLLDAIRKTSVTTGEVGGITQHIGAYNVKLASGGSVTFLDTPGHEAFTSMRMRGAQLTDIVVLVVAADDGVMPQTIEAINHAKAASVPIIVAINKMDKESANPDKVIAQLAEYGLVPEDWGGDTIMVKVSAHTKQGLAELLENLHVQAEVLELKANPSRSAYGTVVEAKLDRGRGFVITVLVQGGTLKKGDAFVAGSVFGRVKAIVSDDGSHVQEAGPSIPVEVLGASSVSISGDDFIVLQDEVQARKIAEERAQIRRRKELTASRALVSSGGPLTLESFSQMVGDSTEIKELPLIVKADAQGNVEALTEALQQISNEEVRVKIIHKAVGGITENDVHLAGASSAIIVAYNVRPDSRAAFAIENAGVEMIYSRIIYDLVDSIKSAIVGRMAPKFQEKTLGHIEVRDTFKVPKLGTVAGSYVQDGTVSRGSLIRLLRDGTVIFEGKMASLRRFKDDVKEVNAGYECGIGLDGYSDIKSGDIMEVYVVEEVQRQ